MNEAAFKVSWVTMLTAFPASDRITDKTRDVYWKVLREIPDDLWARGVMRVMATNQFFPTIRELGVACCGEQQGGLVWKEDPWRERQRYAEEVPTITWQENLGEILEERAQLTAKRALKVLPQAREEDPVVPREKAVEVLRDLRKTLEEKAGRRTAAVVSGVDVEARKRELAHQARVLKANNQPKGEETNA